MKYTLIFYSLYSLFNGFNDKSALRLPVYSSMVKYAGHVNLMNWVPADLKQVSLDIRVIVSLQ